jgi:hypothetical protein
MDRPQELPTGLCDVCSAISNWELDVGDWKRIEFSPDITRGAPSIWHEFPRFVGLGEKANRIFTGPIVQTVFNNQSTCGLCNLIGQSIPLLDVVQETPELPVVLRLEPFQVQERTLSVDVRPLDALFQRSSSPLGWLGICASEGRESCFVLCIALIIGQTHTKRSSGGPTG